MTNWVTSPDTPITSTVLTTVITATGSHTGRSTPQASSSPTAAGMTVSYTHLTLPTNSRV